jgi:F420-dependent oxidoreductase-like protein
LKIGLTIGYSGARMVLPMEEIALAERLGFDSVWTAEAYGSDAFTPLAFIAARTRRIRLGTAIAQLAARTPANCAMIAQTLDALAGEGRVVVGLGASGPQIVEGWYGQPWGNTTARIRDYVSIMRKILRRERPVEHAGAEISLPYVGPGTTGLGKPLKSILHGNPRIPIMLGTSTPANIRLTGELADGWLSMHVTPETLPRYMPTLIDGMGKRTDGKRLDQFEIVAFVGVFLTDDIRAAVNRERAQVALYVGGMGSKEKNYHKRAMIERGFVAEADRIQELYLAGHKEEAAAAVPEAYIDETRLIGQPARIKERLRRWREAGFTLLLARIEDMSAGALEEFADIGREYLDHASG